jgi:hypothetical protein
MCQNYSLNLKFTDRWSFYPLGHRMGILQNALAIFSRKR